MQDWKVDYTYNQRWKKCRKETISHQISKTLRHLPSRAANIMPQDFDYFPRFQRLFLRCLQQCFFFNGVLNTYEVFHTILYTIQGDAKKHEHFSQKKVVNDM